VREITLRLVRYGLAQLPPDIHRMELAPDQALPPRPPDLPPGRDLYAGMCMPVTRRPVQSQLQRQLGTEEAGCRWEEAR
jgi:hypothetical protein